MISNAEIICRHSGSSQGDNWVDSGRSSLFKSVPETVAIMKTLLNSYEHGWGKTFNASYIYDFFVVVVCVKLHVVLAAIELTSVFFPW